jgi:predicted GIY-YIG superfamily endonuclease
LKFIYFLICNNEIKYVGSTVNLKSRIKDHIKTKPAFSCVHAVAVNGHNSCHIEIEALIIKEIKPIFYLHLYPNNPNLKKIK